MSRGIRFLLANFKLKMRHPSSSSSSSSSLFPIMSNSNNNDALVHSVLKLLPAAILTTIVLILPFQDREVLAYMITWPINTNTKIPPSVFTQEKNTSSSKKIGTVHHKPPLFDCDCFDCYISYWFRWDSSPNRDLIHHAIEAFEEGLINMGSRAGGGLEKMLIFKEDGDAGNQSSSEIQEWDSPEDEVSFLEPAELTESLSLAEEVEKEAQLPETEVVWRLGGGVSTDKGLARKVLPDVIGLLNWRFWSLWKLNM